MLACWWLVTRRLVRHRARLLLVLSLAISVPTGVAVLGAVVSASAAPAPGELNARLLSGSAARVQADDPAGAERVIAAARAHGVTPVREFLSTPVVLTGPSAAVSVQLQVGAQLPAEPGARLQLLAGDWPTTAGDACLTEPAAAVADIGVGDLVDSRAGRLRVTCVVRDRTEFGSRAALALGAIDAARPETEDARRATHHLLFAGDDGTGQQPLLEFSDDLAHQGWTVLLAGGNADTVRADDGEALSLLRTLSWILLPVVVLTSVLVLVQAVRRSQRDLHLLRLVGWTPRLSALLAGALVLLPVSAALLAGGGLGLVGAVVSRDTWQRLLGAQWYAVRADPAVLAALAVVVIVVPVLVTATWAGRSMDTRPAATTPVSGTLHRLLRPVAIGAVLTTAAIVVTGQWTFLLLAAVLAAPAVVPPLARLGRRVPRPVGAPGRGSVAGLLRRGHSTHSPGTVLGTALLVAAVLAFPTTAVLMIGGIEGETRTGTSLVPRPSSAVYVGHAPLTATDARSAADAVGARLSSWQSLAIVQPAPDGAEVLTSPAVPALARTVCTGTTADDRCERVLRGVGVADPVALESLLGRRLSAAEQRSYAAGQAMVLDAGLISDGAIPLIPAGDLFVSSGTITSFPAESAAFGPGTSPTSSLPAVFVAPTALTGSGNGPEAGLTLVAADTSYLFELQGPVTSAQERELRRTIVSRVEVSGDDEFLLTRLDAARISVLRQVLDRFPLATLVLATALGALACSMLARDAARDRSVLAALGVTGSTTAAWFGSTLASASALGVAAAAAVSFPAAWVLVRMEVHHGLPGSAPLSVSFLLLVPVVMAGVGWLWGRRSAGVGEGGVTALDTGDT
ncbi:hypothetical protein [Modestobacter sp. SYSU DS0290]